MILIPWSERSAAPSGQPAVLQNAEDELIELAATDFPDLQLNVKGDGQAAADGTSLAALSPKGMLQVSGRTRLVDSDTTNSLSTDSVIPDAATATTRLVLSDNDAEYLLLFIRETRWDEVAAAVQSVPTWPLSLVHPRLYLRALRS